MGLARVSPRHTALFSLRCSADSGWNRGQRLAARVTLPRPARVARVARVAILLCVTRHVVTLDEACGVLCATRHVVTLDEACGGRPLRDVAKLVVRGRGRTSLALSRRALSRRALSRRALSRRALSRRALSHLVETDLWNNVVRRVATQLCATRRSWCPDRGTVEPDATRGGAARRFAVTLLCDATSWLSGVGPDPPCHTRRRRPPREI